MTQTQEKPVLVDFQKLIPAAPPADDLPAGPCGAPECDGGWIYDQDTNTARRCPTCAAQARTARLADQYARAGVEGTLYHHGWDDMKIEHESWRLARALGENIGDVVRDCINVAMVGEKGRGKTQAGVLLAKNAIEAGYSALVVDWAQWVDDVMSDYTRKAKTQAEHVATLTTPDLLVLDDVGAAPTKEGDVERKLFTRVIAARYNNRRPTVITANLSKKGLETAMGDRAFDRIQHACEWMVFDGPAYRAEVEQARVKDTLARIRKAAGL